MHMLLLQPWERGAGADLAQSADSFVCAAAAGVPQLLPASVLRYELRPPQRLIQLILHRASGPGHASFTWAWGA